MEKGRAVVVTTKDKGIFFGYVRDESKAPVEITLADCRNVVYYPAQVKGFLGLTVTGPTQGSRVGPAAPTCRLFDLTGIADCAPEATEQWEKGLWS
jgi:hypothetical protein